MKHPSIALFDSGVGGISVLRALEEVLPSHSFIYFSDSAHFPYGKKTAAELIRYTSQIIAFLISHNLELLVVPCHTISSLAIPMLEKNFPIPIIGMIGPTMRALNEMPLNRRIAIMGTEGTIHSGIYQKAIQEQQPTATLFPLICPELAYQIERSPSDAQDLIREYVKPLRGKKIDALLLACTHYPYLKREIEEELDPGAIVLDPSFSVANEVKRILSDENGANTLPTHQFYTTGDVKLLRTFLERHPLKRPYELKKVDLNSPTNSF